MTSHHSSSKRVLLVLLVLFWPAGFIYYFIKQKEINKTKEDNWLLDHPFVTWIIIMMVGSLLLFSGCSALLLSSQYTLNTPSGVASSYFKETISYYPDSEKMLNLLSSDAQPSDIDSWSDKLEQISTAYLMQGVSFEYVGIENEQINDNDANVIIKYKLNAMGYPTTKKVECSLIKEGTNWKLTKECKP